MTQAKTVALWDVAEFALTGPVLNHPFADVDLTATFAQGNRKIQVTGFYDGDDAGQPTWRFRFMPDRQGEWLYRTASAVAELDAREGAFTCGPPSPGAHGPVRVRNTFHFAHADGTPYYPFGTTCYAWTHQPRGHAGGDARDLGGERLQQGAHGCLPQALHLQRERAAPSDLRAPPGWLGGFHQAQRRRLPPFRATGGEAHAPRHRGRRHRVPSLRPLALLRHVVRTGLRLRPNT